MAYDINDLKARYQAARTQDNEVLDDMKAEAEAVKLDDEKQAIQATQQAVEAANKPAEQPSADFEVPNADMQFTGDKGLDATPTPDADMNFTGKPEAKFTEDELTFRKVEKVTQDIIANAPKNITVGFIKSVKNAVDAVAPGYLEASDEVLREFIPDLVDSTNDYFNNVIGNASTSDKVVQEMSGFMLPFSGYMRTLGSVTKLGTMSKGLAADAMTSFFNVDPHIERLSDVAAEMGIENDLVSYLASDEGSDAENRLRNVVENQAIGGAFIAAAKTLKGVWWSAKAMKKQADEVGLEEFILGKEKDRERKPNAKHNQAMG